MPAQLWFYYYFLIELRTRDCCYVDEYVWMYKQNHVNTSGFNLLYYSFEECKYLVDISVQIDSILLIQKESERDTDPISFLLTVEHFKSK